MGVMAVVGVVFNVCGGDGDTSLPLLWCFVDGAIVKVLRVTLFCLSFRDCCCKGGLAVINVANCACMLLESVRKVLQMPLQTYRC